MNNENNGNVNIRSEVYDVLNIINKRFKELDGHECSEFANKLATLLPIILDKEATMEGVCNKLKLKALESDSKSVAHAEAIMVASDDYIAYKKLRALRIGVEETIRTLKARIKVKLSELKEFS